MEMRGRSGDGDTGVFWRGSGRLCEMGFGGVGDEEREVRYYGSGFGGREGEGALGILVERGVGGSGWCGVDGGAGKSPYEELRIRAGTKPGEDVSTVRVLMPDTTKCLHCKLLIGLNSHKNLSTMWIPTS